MNRELKSARERIVLSRETLYKYRSLPEGTGDEPQWLLKQIGEEIAVLRGIARDVHEITDSIDVLVEAWLDFAEQLKRRAH